MMRRPGVIGKLLFGNENSIRVTILAIIVAVMAAVTKGLTISPTNVKFILLQSSTRGIVSLGQTLVILGRGFDISVGGTALLTGILGSSLLTQTEWQNLAGHPLPISVAVLLMLLTGAGVGALNGFFVSRIGVNTVIATLAMWMITTGIAYQLCEGNTITNIPRTLAFIGQGEIAGLPVPVIFFIGLSVLFYFVLNHTTFGRSVYAIGGNPVSAWLSGLNVPIVISLTFVICGLLAAFAGLIGVARTLTCSMYASRGLELDTIAACFIGGISMNGGKGSVIGTVIGVIILGVINNGMNVIGIGPTFQDLVKGGIILAAVTSDVIRSRS